jgi:tetratricopeptide (TPR) repeat protein
VRCCELNLATLGKGTASQHLQPLEDRALEAQTRGDAAESERLALDVLELAPARGAALTLLYQLRKAQGVTTAAAALAQRLVALDPNNLWATQELALLMLGRGDIAEALRHARNAVRLAPDNAQSHYLVGMALTEAYRPAAAEYHYRSALGLAAGRDPVLLCNLALCLKNQGKMSAARELYEESLAAAPGQLHALLGLARLEEADRNLDAALQLLDLAQQSHPNHPSILLLRATVLGRRGAVAEALEVLDALARIRESRDPTELLEQGRLFDRLGRYPEAFAAYTAGKRRLRELTGYGYQQSAAQQLAQRLEQFFTRKRLQTLPRATRRPEVAQPLFVLGFPRSGTTLLEQTLSAHSRVIAGDELPMINDITNLLPRLLDSPLSYPEALSELWMADHREDLDGIRDHYLRKVAQFGLGTEGATWFTDKMPLNERDLGLISLLFPESPLLHVIRHPLDVVLSVYSNWLTHGYYCAYDLESIARHYVLTMNLVDHYRRELDLRYTQVRYEQIVDDQEPVVRQVLEFIGLPFESRCLAFHENRRYARTASYAQVTERLYDRSRYRFRNYLQELQPVIPILEPVIERLGYAL